MRPYLALFGTQFQLTLQYRAAALAGFATQCWWGAIKVMLLTAFFTASIRIETPMTLAQAITYVWLAQAFLALQPWFADPYVAVAMRTGAVGLERVRPIDLYGWWYARGAATMLSRAVPRATLMVIFAAGLLPALGLGAWALTPPAHIEAAVLFVASFLLAVLLASAIQMMLNIVVVATMTDRGANLLATPLVIFFSGSEIPLPLFPEWAQAFLFVQPLAGILDIPFRIYSGNLAGSQAFLGIALQAFWIAALTALGRMLLARVMHRLEVQGG